MDISKEMSACNNATNCKASFHQLQGMRGLLEMLKTNADEYPLADHSIFKLLKLHFLHAQGECSFSQLKVLQTATGPCQLPYVQRTAGVTQGKAQTLRFYFAHAASQRVC